MIPDSEFECANRLYSLRWPDGLICRCGGSRHRRIATRPRVFVCRGCTKQTSVTAGTLMHGCHVPMRHWFVAAEFLSAPLGVTAANLARVLEVSYETAWQLLHRVRVSMECDFRELAGELVFSMRLARTTRPYRDEGPNTGFANLSCLLAVAEPTAVAMCHLPPDRQTRHWLRDRLGLEERPIGGSLAVRLLGRLWVKLQLLHHGVSELWLPRYIVEMEVGNNEDGTALSRVMRTRRARFSDLRPTPC